MVTLSDLLQRPGQSSHRRFPQLTRRRFSPAPRHSFTLLSAPRHADSPNLHVEDGKFVCVRSTWQVKCVTLLHTCMFVKVIFLCAVPAVVLAWSIKRIDPCVVRRR